MFKKLFGGKKPIQDPNLIDCVTAAGLVVQIGLEKLQAEWPSLKEDIPRYDEAFGHVEGTWVEYEIFLASLGADLLALYNLFQAEKADELRDALRDFLSNMENVGEISVEAVGEYFSVAQLALQENAFPIEYVASLLLQRLEAPDDVGGPLLMAGLMQAVGRLVGGWKHIKTTYKVA